MSNEKLIPAFTWNATAQAVEFTLQPADAITRLKTAVVISLFTDRRGNEEDVPNGELNRGYWGDMDLPEGESLGSKLWLLKREKLTPETINAARDYITEALEWMIDASLIVAMSVTVERQNNQWLAYEISLQLPSGNWEKVIMEHNAYGV